MKPENSFSRPLIERAIKIPSKLSFNSKIRLLSIFVVVLATLSIVFALKKQDTRMRAELLMQAKIAANSLNLDKLNSLSGTAQDLKLSDYYQLKEQLASIRAANSNCRFVYIMGQKPDGQVFFFADSEPVGSEDESPAGQIYDDPGDGTLSVFQYNKAATVGPEKDQWGTWVSAIVPILTNSDAEQEHNSPKYAKAMVETAVEFYEKNGRESLINLINSRNKLFIDGSVYVFVLNEDITMLAHPLKIELVNNDVSDWKDYSGKIYLGRQMQQVALTKGKGWVDYQWEDPVSKKISNKTTYVQKADDLIICAGTYKDCGHSTAVLGMDIDSGDWCLNVFVKSLYNISFVAICATVIITFLMARKKQRVSEKPIFWQLMLPIGTAIIILAGIFSIVIFSNEKKAIQIKENRNIKQVKSEIASYIRQESTSLAATLKAIVDNKVVAKAVKNKDKQELISNCLPLFKNLKQDYGITNLYFFDTDMVYITRIHKTDQDGDVINNWTAAQAAKTGKYAVGLELAPLGVLAVRAVQPVFYEQEIIGYAAIGKDISDLITKLKSEMNIESTLIVDKKYLNRKNWLLGLESLGRSGNWDMLQDSVLLYSSMPTLPDQLKNILSCKERPNQNISLSGRTLHISNIPFIDAAGQQIGRLFVADDITEQKTSFIAMTSIAGFFVLIIVGWMLGFLCVLLKRTDQRIIRDKEAIEQAKSRYDNLATQSRTIMWQVDNNGLYTYISDVVEDVMGYKASELINKKHFYDLHPENDREQFKAAAFEIMKKKGSFANLENLAQTKDGRLVWLNTNGIPAFDKNGNLIGYSGSDTDITENKQAELIISKRTYQNQELAKFGQLALSNISLDELLDNAVALVKDVLNTKYSKVLEHKQQEGVLFLRAGLGWKDGWVGHKSVPDGAGSQGGYTLIQKQPVIAEDIHDEKRFSPPSLLTEHNVVGGITVAIAGDNRPFGVLGVHTDKPQHFTIDDAHFMESVANILSAAIQRLKFQEQTQKAETKFRTIYDYSNDAILLLDENGFFDCNNTALAIFGCSSKQELCSKHPSQLSPKYQLDGTDSITAAKEKIAIAMKQGSCRFEWLHKKCNSDKIIAADVNLTAMEIDGKTILQTSIRDITDRKQAEEQTKKQNALINSLLDSIPDMIFFKDIDGVYLGCNPEFARFVGRDRNDIIGKTDYDLFDKELADFFRQNDKTMMELGKSRLNEEWVTYPDGRKVMLDTLKTPYRGPDGEVIGLIGIGRDNTAKKIAENKLQQNKDFLLITQKSAKLGGWKVNPETDYLEWTEGVYDILEIPAAESPKLSEGLKYYLPQYIPTLKEKMIDCFYNANPFTVEAELLTAKQNIIGVELKAERIVDNSGKIFVLGSVQDITERKQAEQKIEQAKREFELIFSSSHIGIMCLKSGRVLNRGNQRLAEILGYDSPDEMVGLSMRSFHLDEEKFVEFGQKFYYPLTQSEQCQVEYQLRRKDGTAVWCLLSGRAIDSNDLDKGVIWVVDDLQERKQAEIKLKESHEQYMLAINGGNDGIWDWDIANDKIYLSPKWKEMIGYKDDELPNHIDTFIERLHPDEKQVVMDYIKDYLRGKISTYHIELRFRHKDGSYIWILARGEALRDKNGTAYRMAGSHTDITARKSIEMSEEARFERTHRQQSALIKLANDEFINTGNMNQALPYITEVAAKAMGVEFAGIWLFNNDKDKLRSSDLYSLSNDEHTGDIVIETKNFAKYLDFMKNNKILCVNDVATDDIVSEFRQYYNLQDKIKSLLNTAIYISDELLGVVSFEHTDSVHQWESDEINFASAIADQISRLIANMERRMAEEKLRYAMEMANSATKAKSEFLANMSHEIRTPMNAIIGFGDLLAEEQLTQTQREYLATIRNAGKNLLMLINDILDFSKIEAGKMQIEIAEYSVNEIMHHIDSLMRPMAIKKNLDFQVLQCGKLPAKMMTDSTRLTQCLINLVNNAIKFTDTGHIYVNVSQDQQDGVPFIVFDVEDTGIGIPPERQAAVFDSFTQADGSTTRKYGGTGLGLTITRQITDLLGGSISLTSQAGKGSTFTIKLPVGIAVEDNEYTDKYEFVNDLDKPQENKPEQIKFDAKVLVAEDNLSNQMLIKILLTKLGLTVDIAEDGLQAIELANANSYDLILMDMQMPNLNGYEATKQLRQQGVQIPILALTANAMKDDEQKCYDCGCSGYVSKPIDKDKLPQVLAEYLTPISA